MKRNRWVGMMAAGLATWLGLGGGVAYSQEPSESSRERAAREAKTAVEAANQKLVRIRRLVRNPSDPAVASALAAKERAEAARREAVAAIDEIRLAQVPESSAKPKVDDPKAGAPGATTADGYLLLAPQAEAQKGLAKEEWRRAMQAKGYLPTREIRITADDGLLGMAVVPADELLREQLVLGSHGLVVTTVAKGSPAEKAKIAENDILIEMGGKSLTTADDLRAVAGKAKEGPVTLELLRAGARVKIELRAKDPEEAKRQAEVEKAHAEERARHAAETLARRESPKFWIGVSLNEIDATLRSHLKIKEGTALVVSQVIQGSPAEKAGIKKNDVLITHDSKPFAAPTDLIAAVQEAKDQAGIKIKFLRKGTPQFITVKPEARPKELDRTQERGTPQPGVDPNVADSFRLYHELLRGAAPGRPDVFLPGNPAVPNDPALAGRPWVFVTANAQPSQTDAKLDELTKKVEALTKAVEALKDRLPEAAKSK